MLTEGTISILKDGLVDHPDNSCATRIQADADRAGSAHSALN